MRTAGPKRHDHGQHRHNPMKHKRKPPRGMHLNYEDLQVIVNGPLSQADALLKSLDQELVSLKRQVVICSCLEYCKYIVCIFNVYHIWQKFAFPQIC